MENRMETCFKAFFTLHPSGERATCSPALRPPRHTALLLLAGWQPASSSRLAWHSGRSTGEHVQL